METLEMTTTTEMGLQLSDEKLLNLSKEYIGKVVTTLKNRVLDGQLDEIETFIAAKKGLEFFSQVEKQLRPIAEDKIRLAKGEVYKKYGTEISQAETGVSYSFEECNDPQWNRLKAAADEASTELKNREKTLKTFTKPVDVLDPETGEVTTVNPPIRSGKMGIKLSIK